MTGDDGFGVDDSFDTFLTLNEPPPVPSGTPAPFGKGDSQESEDGAFNVFIKYYFLDERLNIQIKVYVKKIK